MIDALIGAVIAVVATTALTLLADVMVKVESGVKDSPTPYELRVFNVVRGAHKSSASQDDLLRWMNSSSGGD